MRPQRRTFPFELRGGKPDGSYFEGHCAVFNSIDHYGTIMGRGCFAKRLPGFLATGFVGGLNHDWDNPIGTPKTAREDETGLFVGADVIDSSHALDVRKYLARKVCKKLSFGFDVRAKQFLETPSDVKTYWESVAYAPTESDVRESQYGALLFTDIEIYEFSPVMLAGNDLADITAVRDGAAERPTLDDLLRSGASTIDELCDAALRYDAMRAATGRGLQPERRALLQRIADRAASALSGLGPRADAHEVRALESFLISSQADALTIGD